MDLNVSQLMAFQRSELDWFYQYALRRVRKRISTPLRLGTWWHSLLSSYFQHLQTADQPSPHSLAAIDGAALRAEMLSESDEGFADESMRLLQAFSAHWRLRYLPASILQIESPLRIPLPETGHFLIGIPDTIVSVQGKLWHLQHKTMSDRTNVSTFVAATQRSLHELIYAFLITESEAIPMSEYGGCYLNIIRKLSDKGWRERPESAFVQELVPIDPEQVSMALRDISCIASRMERILSGEADAIDNRSADVNPYGNSLSDYFEVKIGTASLDDDTLFENFVTRYDTKEGASVEGPIP